MDHSGGDDRSDGDGGDVDNDNDDCGGEDGRQENDRS
jgi:hypothetical protein